MMDIHETVRVLNAIIVEVSRELVESGLESSCIHGSALLTRVLHNKGFTDAYPLTVRVQIFNRAYQEWVKSQGPPDDESKERACEAGGGSAILLGKGTEGIVSDDRWPGHLVVVVPRAFDDRHALVDMTITQANMPERDINLQRLCLRVSDQVVSGKTPFKLFVDGSLLIYDAYAEDHSYNNDCHWMAIKGLDEATANVVKRLIGG